ncbi:hypothetical protein D3C81_512850 [compost metagenome]
MPTAMMVLSAPWPKKVMITSASSRSGKASSTSTRRITAPSTSRGPRPASSPSTVPSNSPSAVALRPSTSDGRTAYTSRARMSRPFSSVPSQCRLLGAWKAWRALASSGSADTSQPGCSAASTSSATNSAASSSPGRKASCRRLAKRAWAWIRPLTGSTAAVELIGAIGHLHELNVREQGWGSAGGSARCAPGLRCRASPAARRGCRPVAQGWSARSAHC